MKKLLFVIICVVIGVNVNAQTKDTVCVKFTGDVAYYSKDLSTFTGLMFSEKPAMVADMNVNAQLKDFSLSAAYSGHYLTHRLQDNDSHFHMLDMYVSYKVKDLNISVGYEATYSDYKGQQDEFGHGLFAMTSWSTKKSVATFIFFADTKIQSRYYIGSFDQKVGNVSLYVLGAYTNTKTMPWYGLIGLKYTNGHFFAGTYVVFDKQNPGACASVGVTFW